MDNTRSSLWRACMLMAMIMTLTPRCSAEEKVRILFLTDCTLYSDWQSIGVVFSYMYSGHHGPITRVMCCSDEDAAKYHRDMLKLVDTHIAPSMTVHPKTGDAYAAYNKPEAVIDYMEKVTPAEEYLVVLDSDMIVRREFSRKDYNVSKGWAAAAHFGYMIGVSNKLADNHIPEIAKRTDNFAGPVGRRSDMVGGYFFIHRDDLKRMSKLWLKYTEDVRFDPEAYKYSGDSYATKPGQKPWISEMYGYSFGAAKANVWHHADYDTMLYPGYETAAFPRVLHYGLEWDIPNTDFKFDKHWYNDFNIYTCPPWDLNATTPKHGIFQHPPRPSELKSESFAERYRDLISIQTTATLNAGLCWWHRSRCKDVGDQMKIECDKADKIFFEMKEAIKLADSVVDCVDFRHKCPDWRKSGECKSNPNYMGHHCRVSCGLCKPKKEAANHARLMELLSSPKGVILTPQRVLESSPTAHAVKAPTHTAVEPASPSTHSDTHAPVHTGTEKAGGDAADGAAKPKVDEPASEPSVEPKQATETKAQEEVADKPTVTAGGADVVTTVETPAVVTETVKSPKDVKLPINSEHVKQLLKRCYSMEGLSIDQIDLCATSAKLGVKWWKPSTTEQTKPAAEESIVKFTDPHRGDVYEAGHDESLSGQTATDSKAISPLLVKELINRCNRMEALTPEQMNSCHDSAKLGVKWMKPSKPIKQKLTVDVDKLKAKVVPVTASEVRTSQLNWSSVWLWVVVMGALALWAGIPRFLRYRLRKRSGLRAE